MAKIKADSSRMVASGKAPGGGGKAAGKKAKKKGKKKT